MNLDDLPDMMTPKMLAERLHSSVGALRNRRINGTGPAFHKVGNKVYYSADAVRDWVGVAFQSTAEAKAANR